LSSSEAWDQQIVVEHAHRPFLPDGGQRYASVRCGAPLHQTRPEALLQPDCWLRQICPVVIDTDGRLFPHLGHEDFLRDLPAAIDLQQRQLVG